MRSQGFETFLPGSALALVLGMAGLAAACSATTPDAGVAASSSAPAVAMTAPANAPETASATGTAMRAYVDPKTGKLVDAPVNGVVSTAKATAVKPEVRTFRTADGITGFEIAPRSALCAQAPTADAPSSQVTLSECASKTNQEKAQ